MEQKQKQKKRKKLRNQPRKVKRKMINLIYTILCIACLCVGFFVGYKTSNPNKTISKVSMQNPIKTVKEKIENKKEQEAIQEQLDELNRIYENIENYDGSNKGQKELKNIEIGIL